MEQDDPINVRLDEVQRRLTHAGIKLSVLRKKVRQGRRSKGGWYWDAVGISRALIHEAIDLHADLQELEHQSALRRLKSA